MMKKKKDQNNNKKERAKCHTHTHTYTLAWLAFLCSMPTTTHTHTHTHTLAARGTSCVFAYCFRSRFSTRILEKPERKKRRSDLESRKRYLFIRLCTQQQQKTKQNKKRYAWVCVHKYQWPVSLWKVFKKSFDMDTRAEAIQPTYNNRLRWTNKQFGVKRFFFLSMYV